METINNVANAAVKVVWGEGEPHKEPVSGVKGDVAKGEPYDAGNLDTPSQEKVELRLGNTGNKDSQLSTDTQATTVATPAVKGDTSNAQNDTRHPDDVPDTVDPDTLTGPGPKPIDVVARQHGGDAGQAKRNATNPTSSRDDEAEREDPEASKGSGEAYVKATGFSADGGDFDAKNPGAGKEADRLIHQKDHNNESAVPAPDATVAGTADTRTGISNKEAAQSKHGKNKPSLSERIKAKFHRH